MGTQIHFLTPPGRGEGSKEARCVLFKISSLGTTFILTCQGFFCQGVENTHAPLGEPRLNTINHVSLPVSSDQPCSERRVWWQLVGDKGQQGRIPHPPHPKYLHVVEIRKEVPVRETSQCVTEEPSCSNTKQPSVTKNTENSKKRYFPSDNFD